MNDSQPPILPGFSTAEQDTARSASVLSEWQKVLGAFRGLYETNGFGAGMVKIMQSPARKAQ